MGHLAKVINNLNVFDATHFSYAASPVPENGGYDFEINHAFFPLFPYLVHKIGLVFGDESLLYVNFCY